MNRRTWKNVVIYLGTTAVSSLLGLGSALLMAHLLAPEQYGRIGLFLSVLYVAAPLTSLAAEGLIAVNLSTLDPAEYERFRGTAVAISLMVFVALELVALALCLSGAVPDALMLAVPLYALLRFATTMATTEYIAEQRAGVYAILTLLNGAVSLGLTYALMTWGTASAGARVLSLMAAESLLMLVRYRGRFHLLRPRIDPKFKAQIMAFGIPSLVALLGGWSLNESDKTVVAHGFGLSVTGLYTAAAALASVMLSFNQSLTNALFPSLYARLTNRTDSVLALTRSYLVKFVALNLCFALFVYVAYSATKDALLPPRYAAASHYFNALVLASLSTAVFRPLTLVCEYFKLARARAVAIVVGGLATLGTSLGGIKYFGSPMWAPAGIAVGYLVAAAILALAIMKIKHDVSPPAEPAE